MYVNRLKQLLGGKRKQKSFTIIHRYNELEVPILVHLEFRNNVRIAFGQENVNLRLPANLSESGLDKHLSWAKKWIEKQLENKSELSHRFMVKNYSTGDTLRVNGIDYTFKVLHENRKTVSANAKDQDITLKIPRGISQMELNKAVKKALSRLFASICHKEIAERVRKLNDLYFKEDIQSVRIKYNKSNWGSCSAKKNINISSRLLFAPKQVQDYVIVHELAHLKELNHSKRFWDIVGRVVPDYKAKEKWLKVNSYWMDF
jgi:predicted metal-dependent hydrolase